MRGETIGNHIIKPSRIRKSINATSGFVRRPRLWVKVNCLLVARGRIQDTYIYIYICMRIRPNYTIYAFQS